MSRLQKVEKAVLLSSCLVIMCSALLTGCKRNVPVHSLEEFAGGHACAVWVRQVGGEGNDPFCESEDLLLMGLDSQDPSGERQILPEIGNYRKPLMTPDGSGIVITLASRP